MSQAASLWYILQTEEGTGITVADWAGSRKQQQIRKGANGRKQKQDWSCRKGIGVA